MDITTCLSKQFVNPSIPNNLPRNMLGDRDDVGHKCLCDGDLLFIRGVKVNVAEWLPINVAN